MVLLTPIIVLINCQVMTGNYQVPCLIQSFISIIVQRNTRLKINILSNRFLVSLK